MRYLVLLLFLVLVLTSRGQDSLSLFNNVQHGAGLLNNRITNFKETNKRLDYVMYNNVSLSSIVKDTSITKKVFTYSPSGNQENYIYYRWDTLYNNWNPDSKVEETFDRNGNKLMYAQYIWSKQDSIWTGLSNKRVFEYDEINRDSSEIAYFWNTEKDNWIERTKDEYTYINDYDNDLASKNSFTWDESLSTWVKKSKAEYYWVNGKRVRTVNYNWDAENSTFKKSSIIYFTLNESEDLEGAITYLFSSETDSIESVKSVYEYNSLDQNEETLYFLYSNTFKDEDSVVWEPVQKIEFGNDQSGNMIYRNMLNWDDQDSSWVPYMEDKWVYDEDGKMVSFEYKGYFEGQFTGGGIQEYVYSPHDERLRSVVYSWDMDSSDWILSAKYEYTFDNDGDMETEKEFRPYKGEWLSDHWESYFYFTIDDNSGAGPIDIPETDSTEALTLQDGDLSIVLFPNPTQNVLNVKVSNTKGDVEILIYDQAGKLVLRERILEERQIDMTHLNSGIYIYRIQGEGLNAIGKLIKD